MADDDTSNRWRLDHKVPLPLILTIAVQTVAFAFWIGSLSANVSENTNKLKRIHTASAVSARDDRALYRDVAELQAALDGLREDSRETRRLVEAMHAAVREVLTDAVPPH